MGAITLRLQTLAGERPRGSSGNSPLIPPLRPWATTPGMRALRRPGQKRYGDSWPNSRGFWQHKPDSHSQPRAALGCGARTPTPHGDAAGPLLRRGAPGGCYSCTWGSRDRCPAPALTAPPCPARRCRVSSVPAAPGPGRRWRPRGVACPGPSAEAHRHRRGREGRRCRAAAAPSSSSRTRRSSSSRSRNAGTVPSKKSDGGKHRRTVPCLK